MLSCADSSMNNDGNRKVHNVAEDKAAEEVLPEETMVAELDVVVVIITSAFPEEAEAGGPCTNTAKTG